ncbi:unnamed protein product [Rotaria sp. Silwood2]|nr:unnamed protein product [Rotaria sp. Silwood2]
MPPKNGGGGGAKKRKQSLDNQPRQSAMTNGIVHGGKNPLAENLSQSKFTIAPLILEGVKLNKLQLNDMIKQHISDVRMSDIQLNRAGIFTLYASDVKSFNLLLNDFTSILSTNGQPAAKVYVPRSIQRVKDTEKVAFVKRVDLELPDDRIIDALKKVGLDVIDVTRLKSKDGNTPTRTIKISFNDAHNRNTFVHTGLQVDSMHFNAEAASQNSKPVQCYICLQYNHVAKYCKTKQQVCSRCGDNHRIELCTAANDAIKCCNCKGNHLATSNDCPNYKEQQKRMLNLINQYSSTSKPTATAPAIHDVNEFPSLPGMYQRQHQQLHNDILDELINVLTSKMEKIIEETTKRLFKSLQEKIKKIEKTIASVESLVNDDDTFDQTSDSDEEIQMLNDNNNKQQQPAATTKKPIKQNNKPTTTSSDTTSKTPTTTNTTLTQSSNTSNDNTKKPTIKQKPTAKTSKRNRSPNSSLDSTTMDNKDLKANNNDD